MKTGKRSSSKMAISKQEKSMQWTGTNKTKQNNGEKRGQTSQTNILKKIAYREKQNAVSVKDKE